MITYTCVKKDVRNEDALIKWEFHPQPNDIPHKIVIVWGHVKYNLSVLVVMLQDSDVLEE